jgi:hypothetical protein
MNPQKLHASKHKILAFYYTTGNLSVRMNSQKDVIELLAICNSHDVKTHRFGAIADIINCDRTILEQNGTSSWFH